MKAAAALRSNAFAGALEQLVVGISFFVFYGVVIRTSGAELVGVLSLVLALAGIGSMGGAGFASALSHYLPLFIAKDERDKAVTCIETTVICTGLFYLLILLAVYFPFQAVVVAQAGVARGGLVHSLMLVASLHVFQVGIGSATSQALTALQRSGLRLFSTTIGSIASLTVLAIVVDRTGIVGAMWAMVVQSAMVVVSGWILLRRIYPELGPVPYRLDLKMARRLLGLGSNMQVQTILLAALEPVTRLLIGQFGTLSAVAFFSMANRFVIQMRALIYAGAQPLLAAFTQARSQEETTFSDLFTRTRGTVEILTFASMSAAVGAAPFIGELWLGSRNPEFPVYAAILAAGWLANALALPTYFNAYSLGFMRHSLYGHAILFAANATFGLLLGWFFGSSGVVIALALSLILSAAYLIMSNGRLLPSGIARTPGIKALMTYGLTCVAAGTAVFVFYLLRPYGSAISAGVVCGLAWAAVMFPALLFNPSAKQLLRQLAGTRGRSIAT